MLPVTLKPVRIQINVLRIVQSLVIIRNNQFISIRSFAFVLNVGYATVIHRHGNIIVDVDAAALREPVVPVRLEPVLRIASDHLALQIVHLPGGDHPVIKDSAHYINTSPSILKASLNLPHVPIRDRHRIHILRIPRTNPIPRRRRNGSITRTGTATRQHKQQANQDHHTANHSRPNHRSFPPPATSRANQGGITSDATWHQA